MQPGTVGASAVQRQWVGLSVQGDSVTVDPLPSPPYLQSLDIEVGFLRRGHEIAEAFSADDMTRHFVKLFNGVIMSANETIVFEYHGQNLKGFIKSASVLELAEEQRRGASALSGGLRDAGIVMDKTDVNFMKAGDSAIKIKSSAKKCVAY
jgi:vesicle-fusing ATPase